MSIGGWITIAAAIALLGLILGAIVDARRHARTRPVPRHSNVYRGETYDRQEIVKAMPPGDGGP